MMKNISKNVVVTLVVVLISFFVLAGATNAINLNPSASPSGGNTTNGNLTGENTTTTPRNTTTNPTGNTLGNVSSNPNIVKINEIDSEKDLPKTGENDIYMITLIGIAAVVIGSIAYVKSKKYDA